MVVPMDSIRGGGGGRGRGLATAFAVSRHLKGTHQCRKMRGRFRRTMKTVSMSSNSFEKMKSITLYVFGVCV